VDVTTEEMAVANRGVGVLLAMGPTATGGDAVTDGTPVARGKRPASRLAGMITLTVRSSPAQNANSEAPAIPPTTAANFGLDMLYLKTPAANSDATTITVRNTATSNTPRKTTRKLTGGDSG